MATTFNSVDPRTGEQGPAYAEATLEDVKRAVAAAAAVHREGALADRGARARLLRGAAGRLRAAGDEIVGIGMAETGLPEVRASYPVVAALHPVFALVLFWLAVRLAVKARTTAPQAATSPS